MKRMKKREVEKLLLHNGFIYIRSNKHEIYKKGETMIQLSHGNGNKEVKQTCLRHIFKSIKLSS